MISQSDISGTAFLLTNGVFKKIEAKTSHGLIRGSTRFKIKAVIDHVYAGRDAGFLLDGISRDIPVYSSLEEGIDKMGRPDFCIIGVATIGGILPAYFKKTIEDALRMGISIVNGLHDLLENMPEYVELAQSNNARLIDIRKPKPFKDLKFWTTEIYSVKCPIIALLGTDCAVGKRTTGQLLLEACTLAGKKAEMIYTGQTGWMQGHKYGFILDATLNDFVCGELSHAIIEAYNNESPDYILLEGQSSMRNPSGPCGPEFLLSGNARNTILVHEVKRIYYDANPEWGRIPSIEEEINLIETYGSKVIALVLNTGGCTSLESASVKKFYRDNLNIPVVLPFEEGVDPLLSILENLKSHEDKRDQSL
jgi:uncharacterized NAD-dependent epimerase/dehydratase family protein